MVRVWQYLPSQRFVPGLTPSLRQWLTPVDIARPPAYRLFSHGVHPIPERTDYSHLPTVAESDRPFAEVCRFPLACVWSSLDNGHAFIRGVNTQS